MRRWLLCLVCAALCANAVPVCAQIFPLGVTYKTVIDAADVISAEDSAAIESTANSLSAETGFPMIVVTIPSLSAQQADDMQTYTEALSRFWASDSAKRNRGIVLVVSPGDRKVWVELGKYWGPYEDDSVQEIEQHVLIPGIKSEGYSSAMRHTVTSLAAMARRDKGNDVRYLWFRVGLYIILSGISTAGPIIYWLRQRGANA